MFQAQHERVVRVSRSFFEQLEEYLLSDERFVGHETGAPASETQPFALVLVTPHGKRLLFQERP